MLSLPIHFLSPRAPAGHIFFFPATDHLLRPGWRLRGPRGWRCQAAGAPARAHRGAARALAGLGGWPAVVRRGRWPSPSWRLPAPSARPRLCCRSPTTSSSSARPRRCSTSPPATSSALPRSSSSAVRACSCNCNWPAARSGMGDGAGLLERERQQPHREPRAAAPVSAAHMRCRSVHVEFSTLWTRLARFCGVCMLCYYLFAYISRDLNSFVLYMHFY